METAVWCVWTGAWDEADVVAVFTTKQAAEEYCEAKNADLGALVRTHPEFASLHSSYVVADETVPLDPHAATASSSRSGTTEPPR